MLTKEEERDSAASSYWGKLNSIDGKYKRNMTRNTSYAPTDFRAGWDANPNKYTEEQMFGFAKYLKDKDLVGAYSNTMEKWLELYLNKK